MQLPEAQGPVALVVLFVWHTVRQRDCASAYVVCCSLCAPGDRHEEERREGCNNNCGFGTHIIVLSEGLNSLPFPESLTETLDLTSILRSPPQMSISLRIYFAHLSAVSWPRSQQQPTRRG